MEQMSWAEIGKLAKSIGLPNWELAHRLHIPDSLLSHYVAGRRSAASAKNEARRSEAERIVRLEAKKRAAELAPLTRSRKTRQKAAV